MSLANVLKTFASSSGLLSFQNKHSVRLKCVEIVQFKLCACMEKNGYKNTEMLGKNKTSEHN
jgi:hypothetical protein